ncbi:hypothetical protein MMAN_03060 [Mycobacterium mantenii]|uniref:Transposase n=1 Tax=Mycobacterium mantenii TaxID=560555 RepID=A0ABM7JL22_MYCNT|nr:hypothetical protein MMAN_03060 [Mycobacterium mantenii]
MPIKVGSGGQRDRSACLRAVNKPVICTARERKSVAFEPEGIAAEREGITAVREHLARERERLTARREKLTEGVERLARNRALRATVADRREALAGSRGS